MRDRGVEHEKKDSISVRNHLLLCLLYKHRIDNEKSTLLMDKKI